MDAEQILYLSNYKVFTKVVGTGSPILLLHSYWGNHTLFNHLVEKLSKKNKVILIDLPGHGKSGPPPNNYTFNQYALVINELLCNLLISEKVSIIGHSMGGYAALAFAAKYPEKILSLVLMHSPLRQADIQSIKQREREAKFLMNGKKDLLLQVTISSNFAPGNSEKMSKELDALNQSACEVSLEGALGAIHAINNRMDAIPILEKANYPVLIIIGKYDKVYRAEEQLSDACLIPQAKVLFLEHSGHLGFWEEEVLVLERLGKFLEEN
ncbi:MAG: alpha/beta hydrolase [Mariniphaga sp.]